MSANLKLPSNLGIDGGTGTYARLERNGRIGIDIDKESHNLHKTVQELFRRCPRQTTAASIASSKTSKTSRKSVVRNKENRPRRPPPALNIVIQIVGSRGDVQPFVALGKTLKEKYGHRVRLATHGTFKDFVEENGLEFFNIGGDPAALMAYMVKNPGLMPGVESLKQGDVGKRRKQMYEIMIGCWRSCLETGDGMKPRNDTDPKLASTQLDTRLFVNSDPNIKPFVAEAIIANPPSFAHIHCAERLGIPVHLAFTMPWSPTHAFPHPLANINSTSVEPSVSNFISYALVDMMTWQGLGDLVNDFRTKYLQLPPLNLANAPAMESRLRIPYTYIWSPALIPKPVDWGSHINIVGFQFLDLATNYKPDPSLVEFLEAGPPPVYIGFGSIVVEDPNALTKLIFDAVKKAGVRALVSKGWGGFGAGEMEIPKDIYMLGNCPHDWLFKRVSAVCHHGGAGTTATGIAAGRPTIIVPFFGDQAFWGGMVYRAGAGPPPIPNKKLTADNLADAIKFALKPETLEKAGVMGDQIRSEDGREAAAESFHKSIRKVQLRCQLLPDRKAVWMLKGYNLRLSALAATVLVYEGCFSFRDLRAYHSCQYDTIGGNKGPFIGMTTALWKTVSNMVTGLAETPGEAISAMQTGSHKLTESVHHHQRVHHYKHFHHSPHGTSTATTARSSTFSTLASSNDTFISPATLKQPGDHDEMYNISEKPREEEKTAATVTTTNTAEEKEAPSGPPPTSTRPSPTRLPTLYGRGSKPGAGTGTAPLAYVPILPMSGTPFYISILDYFFNSSTGFGAFAGAMIKFPGIFSMSLARGFNGVPEKWGDPLFRPLPRVTGMHSGLEAMATIFPITLYDSITGIVREPIACGRRKVFHPSESHIPSPPDAPESDTESGYETVHWSGRGVAKGTAIGIGSLFFKPLAGVWGMFGYGFYGIYRELAKVLAKGVDLYIFVVRRVQGHKEWETSEIEERDLVLLNWSKWYETREFPVEAHFDGAQEL